MRGTRARALYVGGLAAAGVLLTHALSYRLVAPDGPARSRLLEETGHGAWPYIVAALLAAFVSGASLFVGRRLRSAETDRPLHLYRATAVRLIVLQPLGFLLLEGLERAVAGHGLSSALGEPVVQIGMIVQGVVALLGALFLALLARTVDAVVRLLRSLPQPRAIVLPRPPLRAFRRVGVVGHGAATLRGPPTV